MDRRFTNRATPELNAWTLIPKCPAFSGSGALALGAGGKQWGMMWAVARLLLQQSRGPSPRPSTQVQRAWEPDRQGEKPPSVGVLLARPRLQGQSGRRVGGGLSTRLTSPGAVVRVQACARPWPSDDSPQSAGLFLPHWREAETGARGSDKRGFPLWQAQLSDSGPPPSYSARPCLQVAGGQEGGEFGEGAQDSHAQWPGTVSAETCFLFPGG